jgi:hypothetical protein
VFDYDKITVHRDRTYTSTHTRYIAAKGALRQVQIQGSDLPGGPFTTTIDCQIASSLKPVVIESGGSNVDPVPVSRNPFINVGWEIPDRGSRPTNDAPPFTLTGTANPDCASMFGNHFLVWTHSEPSGTVYTVLASTPAMGEAFGGAANIHYKDLPWKRDFNVPIIASATRPGFTGPSTETAQVKVNSTVEMARVDTRPPSRQNKPEVNKIGALLLAEGFASIGGQGTPGGPPAGGSGDEETVIVPGMGTGDVSLNVSGTVSQNRAYVRGRAVAASSPLLATAKAHSTSSIRPVTLKIVPTAAGRDLLSAPHPAITAHYVLSFRPRGSKRAISKTKTIAIPARV